MPRDHSIDDVLTTCALRFDGWAYFERCGDEQLFVTLSDRYLATLRMSSDKNENLAVSFGLQRYLYKWGGDYLPESSREHQGFQFLFLHLYQAEIESDLRNEEYWGLWQSRYADQAEGYAAEIRERLLRKPRGARRRA
jgi:hypothetical protein